MPRIYVSPIRVEAVARQICRNAGHDPDREWALMPRLCAPFHLGDMVAIPLSVAAPQPAWRAFEETARSALQAAMDVDTP